MVEWREAAAMRLLPEDPAHPFATAVMKAVPWGTEDPVGVLQGWC